MGLLPIDLPEMIRAGLDAQAKQPDGLLHASSLLEPLRHSQLRAANAPERPRPFTNEVTLMTGTLWHSWLERLLTGNLSINVSEGEGSSNRSLSPTTLTEVRCTDGMPDGWSGTADWLIWSPADRAFVLGDLKTIRGAGLPYVLRDGAKIGHIWQVSSYWYALRNMGFPLVEGFSIVYLPKDEVPGKDLQPAIMDCALVDEMELLDVMTQKKKAVDEYMERQYNSPMISGWQDGLEPFPDRELHKVWNKKANVYDVVLKPHYLAAYCNFIDCGCNELGQTKVGHIEDGKFVPRKGYEEYESRVTDEALC